MDLSAVADRESLRIDTLGEVLVAVVRDMKSMHLDSLWDARIRQVVQPTAVFERLAKAVFKVSGEHVERPQHKLPVGSLISGVSIELQRTWAALLMLGGLKSWKTFRAVSRREVRLFLSQRIQTIRSIWLSKNLR